MNLRLREIAAPSLALFASTSTLLCCALPALLVSLGAGAVVAGLTSAVPGLLWLGEHKNALFAVAGVLLVLCVILKWWNRNAACPADPAIAAACSRLRRSGSIILGVAVGTYLIGGFFAYFAADLLL
ncbi:MAG: hypothetical protein AB8G17_14140 [Gammaproteobacteria bacterium]